MSGPQRAVAGVVAFLVVLAVVVLALGVAEGPTGRADGSATPNPSVPASATASTPASEGPSASAPDQADLLAQLAEIEAQVEEIRGLPPADIGPPELITRDQLADELIILFEEDYPLEEQERDNIVLRALGLLAADQDVAELQLQLLGDQVLGFYDPADKRMVVVSDTGLDVEAKITYAHEYTHALQDAAFGIGPDWQEVEGNDDATLARVTLVEGDATVAMLAWAFANLTQAELQEYALGAELPDTTGIPGWMVAQLAFPYETGLTWAGTLAGNPLVPDFGAIDDAFAAPPDSTEQVMDATLGAWLDREAPVEVEAPDVIGVLGEGWTEVETTTIGQATIEMMLGEFGASPLDASAAAEGWGGDRALIATGPDGAFAVGWRLAWDSAEDAAEFVAAYRSAAETLDLGVLVTDPVDGEVVVLHASSDEILRLLALELG